MFFTLELESRISFDFGDYRLRLLTTKINLFKLFFSVFWFVLPTIVIKDDDLTQTWLLIYVSYNHQRAPVVQTELALLLFKSFDEHKQEIFAVEKLVESRHLTTEAKKFLTVLQIKIISK